MRKKKKCGLPYSYFKKERISNSLKKSWLFECSQNLPKLALFDINNKNNNNYILKLRKLTVEL